jgi:hypothetical protein
LGNGFGVVAWLIGSVSPGGAGFPWAGGPSMIGGAGVARFGVEHLEAALSAHGRTIIVTDRAQTHDDLVRDMIEVLTSMCARLYGRRGARNRAMRAVTATKQVEAGVDG